MIAALISASLLAASTQIAPNSVIFGIGNESCLSATDPERSLEREVWIMGYWSGLNAANKTLTGKNTDIFAIFAEAERRCNVAPSEKLMQIVLDIWWSMQPKPTA